jgi:hypothetical protein
VRWALRDPAGAPLSCAALGIEEAFVAVGGVPKLVPCGDAEEARFDNLVPGRFPVVIQLRALRITLAEHVTNVVVGSGAPTEHLHTFDLDPDAAQQGNLRFEWTLQGMPAASACELLGARSVRVRSLEGSIRPIDAMAPCADGLLVLERAQRGRYSLLVSLLDGAQATLESLSAVGVQVDRQETTRVRLDFLAATEPARLEARWTVTGSAAVDACAPAGGVDVELELLRQGSPNGPIARTSTRGPCREGLLALDPVTVAPGGGETYRTWAVLRLFDFNQVELASTLIEPVRLAPSRTTTIAGDLSPAAR